MKPILTLFAFLFISNILVAIPPDPPKGNRWILNETTSDEFDGTELDMTKWINTTSRWIGRAPGLFKKEAMSMGDGNMRLTQDKLSSPEVVNGTTYTHQGGHIISKLKVKPGSYIECRMKANKTFMSSTFWLINYSNESSGCDRRTTELDIQECVGEVTGNNNTATERMGSNTHSRNVPSGCDIPAGSVGNHVSLGGKAYDDFYIYAVWWKSPTEMLFYLNDEYQYTIHPAAPFSIHLYVKLVTETYDWNPAPGDGGMNKSWEERTTFYDYVRTYNLVEVDDSNTPDIDETIMFPEMVAFVDTPDVMNNADQLVFSGTYKANTDQELHLAILDESGSIIAQKEFTALAGYGIKDLVLPLTNKLQEGVLYKAQIHIRPLNASDNTLAYGLDEFEFEISDPKELTFVLKDKRTGLPVQGAEVSLDEVSRYADAEGIVVFPDVPVEKHNLNITAFGYTSRLNIELLVQEDESREYLLEPELFRVNVFLKDSINQNPIEDARIVVDEVSRKTDSSGKTFYNLYLGNYTMDISHDQYGDKTDTLHLSSADDVSLFLARKLTNVDFKLYLDDASMGYATISLNGSSKQASYSGNASFINVPTNVPLTYSVNKNGKLWVEETTSFYNDTTVTVELFTPIQKNKAESIRIYPNPSSDEVYISGVSSNAEIRIVNVAGIEVLHLHGNRLNVNELNQGIYLMIINDQGQSYLEKIAKQ